MTESDWPKPVQLSKTIPGPACEGPECMLSALGSRSGTELRDSVAAQWGSISTSLLCARLFPRPSHLPMKAELLSTCTDGKTEGKGA